MRGGDYHNEKKFGLPTSGYYRKAIQHQLSHKKYEYVMVFTNDEKMAYEKLIGINLTNLVMISERESLSPNETIELMRLGTDYVISNSTFGWWGAFLSKSNVAKVIFPDPWFKGMTEPNQLIPPNWTRIQSDSV
jgi:hypothetical protein